MGGGAGPAREAARSAHRARLAPPSPPQARACAAPPRGERRAPRAGGGAERAAGAGVAARCRRRAVGAVTANPRLSARLGRAAAPRPAGRDQLRPLPLVWLTEIAATVRGSVAAP